MFRALTESQLWPIPAVIILLALWFFYQAYRGSKSNSTQQVPDGKGGYYTKYNTGNIPIYKLPTFKLSIVCLILAIISIVWINAEW